MFLYISDRIQTARFMQKALSARNFFILYTPLETAEFLCEKKDTGGVVLDGVSDLSKAERICANLRKSYPALPIAAIVSPDSIPNLSADTLIRDHGDRNALLDQISDFFVRLCHWSVNKLSTYSLTVDPTAKEVRYMGYPLSLTNTELRVLYCLFYRAPSVTATDDLMELCFPGMARSVSNLTVRIHQINRRASRIDPRPLIIRDRDGYRLRDGIV